MHTEFAHVPSSFLSKTRDPLFFLLRPTPPLAFWILPHCIYSENLPVDYVFSILCSEAQASIIFPLSSQPPPITTFFLSILKLLESVICIFYLHFLPTTKSSAQNSTNNSPWKQLSLKLTITYKRLSQILSYLIYQQHFTHPTSDTQISISIRELSWTSTSIYPAAYLMPLLMSQRHTKLNSCFLQTQPFTTFPFPVKGSWIHIGLQIINP